MLALLLAAIANIAAAPSYVPYTRNAPDGLLYGAVPAPIPLVELDWTRPTLTASAVASATNNVLGTHGPQAMTSDSQYSQAQSVADGEVNAVPEPVPMPTNLVST